MNRNNDAPQSSERREEQRLTVRYPTGIVWGASPVFLLPTSTDELLGSGKWGAGPTTVVLKQDGPWTYGMLYLLVRVIVET